MKRRNLTIGSRLTLGFILIFIILLGAMVFAYVLTTASKERVVNGLQMSDKKSQLIGTMKSSLLESGLAMRNIGIETDVGAMQREEGIVKAQQLRYQQARDKLKMTGLNDLENSIIAEIAKYDAETSAPFAEAIGQALAFDTEGAAKIIATHINPLNQRAIVQMDRLVTLQKDAATTIIKASLEEDKRLQVLLLGLVVLSLAVGAVCAWTIRRSIVNPLIHAVDVASAVATGDLTSRSHDTSCDEVGMLFKALRQMNDSLSQIVRSVRAGTNHIDIASREIAAGNADLSARTEVQASSLQRTASSMEQLTATVNQNAAHARQANQLASSASTVATQGGEVVNQVVATMQLIKSSSQKILDITSVIDGIAFQTNMLALNAAVEASRAGQQGRGFAVVASEVRVLAQRSAEAAREIKALIDDSVKKVNTGCILVDEAGKTMEAIVASVSQVAGIINEISCASTEQSIGIQEIGMVIIEMDEMTQRNAALVEEAAAATVSMQYQAEELAQIVEVFKVLGDDELNDGGHIALAMDELVRKAS